MSERETGRILQAILDDEIPMPYAYIEEAEKALAADPDVVKVLRYANELRDLAIATDSPTTAGSGRML